MGVSSHELGKNHGSFVTGATGTGMGRQTPLTKPKEADVPCHTRLPTHAPSATQGRNGLVGSRASVKEFWDDLQGDVGTNVGVIFKMVLEMIVG